MTLEAKLFRVKMYVEPEWGQVRTEWVKYYFAPNLDTVRSHVYETFGKPRYYSLDREEVKYNIEETPVTVLGVRSQSEDDEEF
jgi:hypothetical protein